jgi:cysteine desulfurase
MITRQELTNNPNLQNISGYTVPMSTKKSVYLDHNATTPVRPEAVVAITDALALEGNPSSIHAAGRAAKAVMERARDQIAFATGATAAEVVFTSGGTEANGATLIGSGAKYLVVSATEHDSIISGAEATSLPVHVISVDDHGILELEGLKTVLSREGEGGLVSVMLANNETGVVQAIRSIADIGHDHGALVHCDAVQALGKIPVDMAALDVDYLSVSAHKIGGPKGVGALVVRAGLEIAPLVTGGGQEKGRRSGTENLIGIAGFGAAASVVEDSLRHMESLQTLRDTMEVRLLAIAPGAVIFGRDTQRLPNTTCIGMPGVRNELQVMAFDLEGLFISAGSACSSGKVASSHVLAAMHVDDAIGGNAIRISLGWNTQAGDIDRLVDVWEQVYRRQADKAGQ